MTVALGAATIALAVAACSPNSSTTQGKPGGATTQSPPQPTAVTPTEDSSAEAELLPNVIPGCDGLITDDQAKAELYPDYVRWDGFDDPRWITKSFGQAAVTAYDAAVSVVTCDWGVPDSNHLTHLIVAELPTKAREQLVAELRDSAYVETVIDGVTHFSHESTDADGVTQRNWYGFVGNVWVAAVHARGEEAIQVVFDNLRDLNPEWRPALI